MGIMITVNITQVINGHGFRIRDHTKIPEVPLSPLLGWFQKVGVLFWGYP